MYPFWHIVQKCLLKIECESKALRCSYHTKNKTEKGFTGKKGKASKEQSHSCKHDVRKVKILWDAFLGSVGRFHYALRGGLSLSAGHAQLKPFLSFLLLYPLLFVLLQTNQYRSEI